MNIKRLNILIIFLIIIFFYGKSFGAILDQSQLEENSAVLVFAESSIAQTFIPTINGELHSIELIIMANIWGGTADYPTDISIIEGNPTGNSLGKITVAAEIGWNEFVFSQEKIFLTAGNTYSIVFSNDDPDDALSPTFFVRSMLYFDPMVASEPVPEDVYLSGELWTTQILPHAQNQDWKVFVDNDRMSGGGDLLFKTWVNPVPIPSTLLLLGSGIVGVIGFRKKFKKA